MTPLARVTRLHLLWCFCVLVGDTESAEALRFALNGLVMHLSETGFAAHLAWLRALVPATSAIPVETAPTPRTITEGAGN